MRRRDFNLLLGGAAFAWLPAARAQQTGDVRRVAVLMNVAADDPEGKASIAVFKQAMEQSGWSEGRNLRIDYRGRPAMQSGCKRWRGSLLRGNRT